MLKWLVQRVPDPGSGQSGGGGAPDLITDDPLAVLELGKKGGKKKDGRNLVGKRRRDRGKKEIYSVNR